MADLQTPLFGCFQDMGVCLIGCFVPCYLMAVNLARVDNRECAIWDCCCASSPNWVVRNRIRAKYGLEYAYTSDCLISMCCGCCAAVQHSNELKAREALLSH